MTERARARKSGAVLAGALIWLALVASGCSQTAPGASSSSAVGNATKPGVSAPAASAGTAAGATDPAWQRLVDAAKQEGQLAVILTPGDPYRQFVLEFEKRYGVTVSTAAANGPDLVGRLGAERSAGQYLWDAMLQTTTLVSNFYPNGGLEPLKPALMLPEVVDNSRWMGGLDGAWIDTQQTYGFIFVAGLNRTVYVNRGIINEAQLGSLDQLMSGSWKGKIGAMDPRIGSSGRVSLARWLQSFGEDKVRQFLRNQQPVLTQDARQVAEWGVRGQYPISFGLSKSSGLQPLVLAGVDTKAMQPLDPNNPAGAYLSFSTGGIALWNRAPHPNAARLFVNWVLSREGQTLYAQITGSNSRRTDVPVSDPDVAVDPAKFGEYTYLDGESSLQLVEKAQAIAREELK